MFKLFGKNSDDDWIISVRNLKRQKREAYKQKILSHPELTRKQIKAAILEADAKNEKEVYFFNYSISKQNKKDLKKQGYLANVVCDDQANTSICIWW